MAKDDYHVLAFRVLTYLYACMKDVKSFNGEEFLKSVVGEKISKNYLHKVLAMLNGDGYIEGFKSIKAWGGDIMVLSDCDDIGITSRGIEYLQENSMMNKVKTFLLENSAGYITTLIELIFK